MLLSCVVKFMNSNVLSERLKAVANFIPKGCRLADIGSDHAYLPCYTALQGIVSFAVAGEVADGPYCSAKREVETQQLTHKISVRKGDGLEVISEGEVDCITIAGMGGVLIASILERGKDKLSSVKRLILQPNTSAHSVRKWLLENEWELKNEVILEEDGKVYEILVAEKGDPQKPYVGLDLESSLLLGPFLQKEKNDPFRKKWTIELQNWNRALKEMDKALQIEKVQQKRNELKKKIQMVEEALADETGERS